MLAATAAARLPIATTVSTTGVFDRLGCASVTLVPALMTVQSSNLGTGTVGSYNPPSPLFLLPEKNPLGNFPLSHFPTFPLSPLLELPLYTVLYFQHVIF